MSTFDEGYTLEMLANMHSREFLESPEKPPAISSCVSQDERTVLIGGSYHPDLVDEVAGLLDFNFIERVPSLHPNHESRIRIPFDISGRGIVTLISPGGLHVNDQIIEAMLIGDAAKRNHGKRRQLVASKWPYDRQERQSFGEREPIAASDIINLLTRIGKYKRIMGLDLHTEGIMGATSNPWDRNYVTQLMAERIKSWNLANLKIVAPDAGFVKGAFHYATKLEVDYANINKYRDPKTGITSMNGINGDVEGTNCVIVDDVISSGLTMIEAAQRLIEEGGALSVSVAAAHGEFANDGRRRLVESPYISHILTTNSLPQYPDVLAATGMDKKIEVVSVAPLLAEGIRGRMKGAKRPKIFIY